MPPMPTGPLGPVPSPYEWDPLGYWMADGKLYDWATGNVPVADALGGGTGR
jgi:hypothetical protein